MKIFIKIILILLLFAIPMLIYGNNYNAVSEEHKVWRIGYIESGSVPLFNNALKGFVQQLIKDDYLSPLAPNIFKETNNKKIWGALSDASSNRVKFVKKAFLENDWRAVGDALSRKRMCKCIKENKLDVVLVMGTLAAQKCISYNTDTVFIIVGASNVYMSGITASKTYSGFDNVFATIDSCKYKQQIKTFHSIIGFDKLGVVYKDTVRNRTYAGIDDIEEMSKTLDFEIATCFSNPEERNMKESVNNLEGCYKHLAKSIDAMYITVHGALLDHNNAYKMALPFLKNKIPTFVQEDAKLVEHGFLMSIVAKEPGKDEGTFTAKRFEEILNGATPGKLDMRFHEKTSLFINKRVAEIIGVKIPDSILMVADKVYERIKHEE